MIKINSNNSKSFVAMCDYNLKLIELIDKKNMDIDIKKDESILKIVYEDSLVRFFDFANELRNVKSIFGQEVSIKECSGIIINLNLAGIALEGKLIIVAFSNYFELYEDLIKINSEQTNLIRDKMKKFNPFTNDYDLLGNLNNELINTKRELQKKNLEVTELLDKKNDLNKNLEELVRTKNMILSIISHDIRSPLASIIQILQLINETEDGGELLKEGIFKNLTSISQNTLSLLDDLVEWSKCQNGTFRIISQNFYLDDIVEETVELLRGIAKGKNINLYVDYEAIPSVCADKRLISIILRNLITNAIKFTHEGGKVIVKSSIYEEKAIISVIDNGVGISEEAIQSLFNLKKSTTNQGTNGEKGSGFGLLMCKTFAKKNNGDIYVKSQLNKGTEFSFTVPLGKSV
ncbi:HAMP domain-containing sensor histidine kinase [Herbivorax sp. ANBcel31]|uniref:sensor histidine kinase n=1 Tax=Herbivorax sp. ANBcel31 TaxID=3069754 RepID=UPI0027AF2269|nr:HAMP domain-containing sensor histidine kinase [Herbivorax sp. ANBcel31]MDQ2085819.1 HAMP domain-containing sensor histidine kinase [Herbivorax sp. ANBcel31]